MKNFDRFIGIDWSGARSPVQTKSIAVATLSRKKNDLKLMEGLRSRTAVADYLAAQAEGGGHTLVGIDCNFGYAATVLKRQLGKTATAHALWTEVERLNQDQGNYFAGGFWTAPEYRNDFWTEGKMRPDFQMPRRVTEQRCIEAGYGIPESPFKMIGAKQVGKGGLAGMRMVYDLRRRLGSAVAVWPFDDLETCDAANIVITEIFPRQFIRRAGEGSRKIGGGESDRLKHCLQKMGYTKSVHNKSFSDHDTDALVSAAGLRYLCGMNATIPNNIASPENMSDTAKACEGWIFGVGDTD